MFILLLSEWECNCSFYVKQEFCRPYVCVCVCVCLCLWDGVFPYDIHFQPDKTVMEFTKYVAKILSDAPPGVAILAMGLRHYTVNIDGDTFG